MKRHLECTIGFVSAILLWTIHAKAQEFDGSENFDEAASDPDDSGEADEFASFSEGSPEDVWLDSWWWDWDPEWSAPWLPQISPWTFSISAGLRSFDTLPLSSLDAPVTVQRRREFFAWASLRFPLSFLNGSASKDADQARARTRAKSRVSRVVSAFALPAQGSSLQVSRTLRAQPTAARSPEEEPVVEATPSIESGASNEDALFDRRGASRHEPGVDDVGFPEDQRGFVAQDLDAAFLLLVRKATSRVTKSASRLGQEQRLRSLVRRSRTSGLVPEVRLRTVWGFDSTTSSEDAVGIYPGETTTRGGRDSLLEARLTFRLDRLILGAGESSLERQRAGMVEDEERLLRELVEAITHWLVAARQATRVDLLLDERVKVQAEASLELARAHLLSGGWFQGRKTLKDLNIEFLLLTSPEPAP